MSIMVVFTMFLVMKHGTMGQKMEQHISANGKDIKFVSMRMRLR